MKETRTNWFLKGYSDYIMRERDRNLYRYMRGRERDTHTHVQTKRAGHIKTKNSELKSGTLRKQGQIIFKSVK